MPQSRSDSCLDKRSTSYDHSPYVEWYEGVNDVSNATPEPDVQPSIPAGTVQPIAEMVVSDLAVLRVLSDGLRLQLLEAFGRTRGVARSVKEVAREIGQSPTKLYYHVNMLEEHGLLLVAESRLVSGIVEKRYVPAARRFNVDRALLRTAEDGSDAESHNVLGRTIDTVLRSTGADLKRAMAAGLAGIGDDAPPGRKSLFSKSTLRLKPDDAQKVLELLETLAQREDDDDSDADTYGLTVAFFRRGDDGGNGR